MASETVAYELKITGNLESNARAAARAIENLGTEAKETKVEVRDMGESFDKAGAIGERVGSLLGGVWGDLADVTLDLGGKIAGLTSTMGPLAAGAVAAGAAVAILGAAAFMVTNRAVEASAALDNLGVAMDTPELDKYSASMTDLGVAFDKLWVTVGEGLAGPLSHFLDWTTTAVNHVQAVVDKLGLLGLLMNPDAWFDAAGRIIGTSLAGGNPLPYGEYGPSMDWMNPSPAPGKPKNYAGMYNTIGVGTPSSLREYQAMDNLIGVQQTDPSTWDRPFRWNEVDAANAETAGLLPKKPRTPGVGIQALAAGASGGGLGGVLGALGPWGGIAAALATPDIGKNLSGVVDQSVDLIKQLPDILTSVLTEFLPHLITSLDDIIMAAVDALIFGLPEAIADALSGGILGGGKGKKPFLGGRGPLGYNALSWSYADHHQRSRDNATTARRSGGYGYNEPSTAGY